MVEVHAGLAAALRQRVDDGHTVHAGDFLEMNGSIGDFDRIVMNPPFERGADIRHIRHAYEHLRPGGRLVAICAGGPRQVTAFRDEAVYWIDLEPGTFAGTDVRAVIVALDKPE